MSFECEFSYIIVFNECVLTQRVRSGSTWYLLKKTKNDNKFHFF